MIVPDRIGSGKPQRISVFAALPCASEIAGTLETFQKMTGDM
jgi:hypothetical protein